MANIQKTMVFDGTSSSAAVRRIGCVLANRLSEERDVTVCFAGSRAARSPSR